MDKNQTRLLNDIHEATRGKSFNMNNKTVNGNIALHRRGLLAIQTKDSFMGRAIFKHTQVETKETSIVTLNVSIPYTVQGSLKKDGLVLCKNTTFHYTDLAVRHLSLRTMMGNSGEMILIGEENTEIIKELGYVLPFETVHAWVPGFESIQLDAAPKLEGGRILRTRRESMHLTVRDYGETKITWKAEVPQGGEMKMCGMASRSTIEVMSAVMSNKYVMGSNSKMSEEVLVARLTTMSQTWKQIFDYRGEKVSESDIKTVTEYAFTSLTTKEEFSL